MVSSIPAFKRHLHVTVVPGEGVVILSEARSKAFTGTTYEKVCALIDGVRSEDDILDALVDEEGAARVYFVLGTLRAQGFLAEENGPDIPEAEAAFWHAADLPPAAANLALRSKSASILTVGDADPTEMAHALEAAGVRQRGPDEADLWVAVADDYLNPELAVINREALAMSRRWLLVRPNGPQLWLGPLFLPHETGCWTCLQQRLIRHRAVHRFIAAKAGSAGLPIALGELPATRRAAFATAAALVATALGGAGLELGGKVLSLDWKTLAVETHRLLRHPHCPACGVTALKTPRAIELKSGRAAFTHDGGHRSVSPEQTLKTYGHLVSPITGVVHSLAAAVDIDDVAKVFVAGHNPAVALETVAQLKHGLRSASSGKGVSEAQAKASALCEAIERYSLEWRGDEIAVEAAFKDWAAGDAIRANDVMRFSMRQFAERTNWNAKESRFNRVPRPVADDEKIYWTPVWSLTESRFKQLPTALLYSGHERPTQAGFSAIGCSNGAASGNTMEEAILQGFFELVERDAVAIWWYNRLKRPGVDLASFEQPYLQQLSEHYLRVHGMQIWALDLTTDLGIPAFAAVAHKVRGDNGESNLFAFGSHLDAGIALQRAFAELNQMRGLATRPDIDDPELMNWFKIGTLAANAYLVPDPDVPPSTRQAFPIQHTGDFRADITHCRAIVQGLGHEILVLDQTRADVGMPVVKVVVPGLRHFWARYAPGRLYDVPVKMGWRTTPLTEEELNPVPVFI